MVLQATKLFLFYFFEPKKCHVKNQICAKKYICWSQNPCSWFWMDRLVPYRVIRTSTKKHAAFIQKGEDLGGSRVGLETSHTGAIGYRPDPDLSRHRARAHCGWGWEGETSHWWLVTTEGLKTAFIQYYNIFWQLNFLCTKRHLIYSRKHFYSIFSKEKSDKCEHCHNLYLLRLSHWTIMILKNFTTQLFFFREDWGIS